MNLIDFFKAQKTILENLFGADWFIKDVIKKDNHPAYKRWLLSTKLIKQNGIVRWPEDKEKMSDIASIILDNFFIVKYSGGDLDRFTLGTFSNYNEKVRKRIYTEIEDPSKFFDKLTELSYSAWHLSEGNEVIQYEEDGYPDFKVYIKDIDLPIATDCKRIKVDTQDNRFAKDITKANKQIKALNEECYGVVVIDISDKIRNPDVFSDEIPEEVERISRIVKSAILNFNSAVSGVLLIWDDYVMLGIPGKAPKSTFAYRKRNMVLRHSNPRKELPDGLNLFDLGNTLVYDINWTPR